MFTHHPMIEKYRHWIIVVCLLSFQYLDIDVYTVYSIKIRPYILQYPTVLMRLELIKKKWHGPFQDWRSHFTYDFAMHFVLFRNGLKAETAILGVNYTHVQPNIIIWAYKINANQVLPINKVDVISMACPKY